VGRGFRGGRRNHSMGEKSSKIVQAATGSSYEPGYLGAFERTYPPRSDRDRAISAIRALPADKRSPDQWWMLGEYLVFNGLLDEEESTINDGIDALTEGANLPNPSTACLMDLGWVLSSKGLDSLALPYLRRASDLAQESRDILSLKAWAEIGLGKRDEAIQSLSRAVNLANATDTDRETLAALQDGGDLKDIRKKAVLRKIGFGDPDLAQHPPAEQAKAAIHLLKAVYDRDPADVSIAYPLAYARYVAGQLTKAKPLLHAVVAADPSKDEAWTILGLIAKKTGDPDGELAMYRKAIETNPRSALALMNFASRTMHEDAVKARNYLETAIDEMGPASPHYACALHLMGNSFAYIEEDYLKEIEYHKKAVALDPRNGLYRDNLILALLSAGRPIDARRLWRETKQTLSAHPLVTDELIAAFCDETLDPRHYLVIVDRVGKFIGEPGRRVLLNRAWRRRSHVEDAEQLEFLSGLATMASQAGDDELALQAWREAAPFDATGAHTVNEAVALSRLGRTSEALTLIESGAPAGERFHTMVGNIRRQAGLQAAAIEAYRKAVETEPRFVLPFLNAFDSIKELRDPSLAEPFISALMKRWEPSPRRSILLAEGHLLAGRPATAADFAFEALVHDGNVIQPEDVHSIVHDADDPSLFVSPSAEFHKLYALALLRCRRLQKLSELLAHIFDWPRWADGDWRILNAEIARISGSSSDVPALLEGMDDQIPALISLALVALENDDADAAERLAMQVSANSNAGGYSHPDGRPDAMAHAIMSCVARSRGELRKAEESGREAVRRDPACVLARAVLVNALVDLGENDEVETVLTDALRRLPSEPRTVRLAVETLVDLGQIERAGDVLAQHRPGLTEYGSEDLGYRLGEHVAAGKLATTQTHTAETEWPWIQALTAPLSGWLASAHHSLTNLEQLKIALAMFTAKVAEKVLVDRLLIPFREANAARLPPADDRLRDVDAFLTGGRPPSLGGIVRLLRYTAKSFSSADPAVLKAFRMHIRSANWRGRDLLQNRAFLDKLQDLANVRNDSAHVNEPSADQVVRAISIVVDQGRPGDLFRAVGIEMPENRR